MAAQWLRADLAVRDKALDRGPEADRVLVRQRLAHQWTDPDLAVLLDPDSQAKLAPADGQEARKLRDDINALIKRSTAFS
jgi:hypothetical protein